MRVRNLAGQFFLVYGLLRTRPAANDEETQQHEQQQMILPGSREDSATALCTAVQNGSADLVRSLLLIHGADAAGLDTPDGEDCTPLLCAADRGHAEVSVVLLIDSQSKGFDTPEQQNGLIQCSARRNEGHGEVATVLGVDSQVKSLDTPEKQCGFTRGSARRNQGNGEVSVVLLVDSQSGSVEAPEKQSGFTPLRFVLMYSCQRAHQLFESLS